MFNLLRARNVKIIYNCSLSKQVFTSAFRRSRTFCYHNITYTHRLGENCGVELNTLGIRQLSTSLYNKLIVKELKKRKQTSKYKKRFTELLEVISGGHSETVASVKKLKANDVSLLAENPNISLEHLHSDLKAYKRSKKSNLLSANNRKKSNKDYNVHTQGGKLHNKKQSKITSTNPDKSSSTMYSVTPGDFIEELGDEVNGLTHLEGELLLNDPSIKIDLMKEIEEDNKNNKILLPKAISKPGSKTKQKNAFRRDINLTRKEKENLMKNDCKQLQIDGKIQNLNSILLAYIDTCVSCGFLNRGLATLQYYVKLTNKSNSEIKPTDIRIFDTLLQGFASKGKMEKFNEVWNMIKHLNIKPSCNSYAANLECVIYSCSEDRNTILSNIVTEMNSEGITINDLFEKCKFLGDQRQVLLNGLREIYPDFEPKITPPDLCYSCSLLNKLNEEKSNLLRSPVEGLFNAEELIELGKEQLEYEMQGTVPIKSIEKRDHSSPFIEHYRSKLNLLKSMWEKSILKALERDINIMNSAQSHMKSYKFPTLFPYLKILDADQYKDIIMQEIIKLAEGSESFSPTTFQLYKELATKVRLRYIVKFKNDHKILEKTKNVYNDYCKWYVDPMNNEDYSYNSRQEWQKLVYLNQEGPTINVDEKEWPIGLLTSLGRFLYNIILHDIKIDVNVLKLKSCSREYLPAFYTIFRQQNNKCVEEIKPHPMLSKLLKITEREELLFNVNFVPMACPPLPWSSPDSGGYLLVKTDFLRLPLQACHQKEKIDKAPIPQLYPSYDSLNQLSCVPWKVNKQVLDTMISVFNNGGSSKLEVPEPPSACPMPEPVNTELSKMEQYQNFKKRLAVRRKKAEMYSLWCDALYRLSLANHFRDRVFWLPHNMDFRGRVYPCPPHLNHLGPDLARSLLCFAKGKPLGETGLDWLKIHVVNLTGLKKRNSIIERLVYANEIIEDIIDSAQNPLSGRMWWAESENPWQTLACCIEIWNAIQHPDGPASYISHFPIHQDGSCNGLQHYAALGRDRDGAVSVNLSPAMVPQDVYSCVAAIVEQERAKDAQGGSKVAQQLDGFIKRKVIKQTVMTTVYGVTRFGARLQIAKQLKDIDSFPKDYVWPASTYLVGKTFESLRQMFTSTREIQDWFTECARLISQVCGENVDYVTPLGLPVVQPYTHRKHMTNSKNLYGRIDSLKSEMILDTFSRPNVMKQKNAFPPNFIHSLDSSHMMLTSLHCEQAGITFVSVHDCFWTHPCTVHIMNKICREQFVALHSQPILENLSSYLIDRFGYTDLNTEENMNRVSLSKYRLNTVLKKVPTKGQFNLEEVINSIYFFS